MPTTRGAADAARRHGRVDANGPATGLAVVAHATFGRSDYAAASVATLPGPSPARWRELVYAVLEPFERRTP